MNDLMKVVSVLEAHQVGTHGTCVDEVGLPCDSQWRARSRNGYPGFIEQHREHVAEMLAAAGLVPHRPVSVDGWTCDVCGASVSGQTDEDGVPLNQGEAVSHLEDVVA